MNRSDVTSNVLGADLYSAIRNCRILMVGAGGIGCELLKNLVMCGFGNIDVIDLDTIEVSNLNRQFLFQRKHVGSSKAKIAKESALMFNPNVTIRDLHDNIKSVDYGLDYFKQFSIVLNALDNISARNHVNRMCLAADVPLIESGSGGYLGQVTVIRKGKTECFECVPKPPPKQHPVCTIRNTPSLPIHCIVWGKFLFNQLFGHADDENDVSPNTSDPEAVIDSQEAMHKEPLSNQLPPQQRKSLRKIAEQLDYNPQTLFQKLFCDDVRILLSMDKLWSKRSPPVPLDSIAFEENLNGEIQNTHLPASHQGKIKDQLLWTLVQCRQVFETSITALKNKFLKEKEMSSTPNSVELLWDKDDEDAMDFVTAVANLRMKVFGIPMQTRFDVKSMAGNIIPAIATTNAIVAGIIVMEAFKILAGDLSKCRTTYVVRKPNSKKKILQPVALELPNPSCLVCCSKPTAVVALNTVKMTLDQFKELVLKQRFGMISPELMEGTRIVLSSDGEETAVNDQKTLEELNIVNDCRVFAEDSQQDYTLTIWISHKVEFENNQLFEVIDKPKNEDMTNSKKENKAISSESVSISSIGSANSGSLKRLSDDNTDDDDIILQPEMKRSRAYEDELVKSDAHKPSDDDLLIL